MSPLGSHTPGDAVLDTRGHSPAGETGDRALVRNARMFYYGEDSEVRRGRENIGPPGRGGRRA